MAVAESSLTVTVLMRMEILRGRFDSILKAADEGQLRSARQCFLEAQGLLNSFLTLPVNDEATRKFSELQTGLPRGSRHGPD